MNKNKSELRNQLFEKYFEINDGMVLSDLISTLKPNIEVWKELRKLLEQNVKEFHWFHNLKKIDTIEYNQKKYLIIEFGLWKYLIVDLLTKQVLTEDDINLKFNQEMFEKEYLKYNGNLQDLIDFYNNNQEIFNSKQKIYYQINIGEAYTYLLVDLINGRVQLGFQTPDQFLYEQLFLNIDLTPFSMQDAMRKIGIEKMEEMFNRIKNIRIPKEFYQENNISNAKLKVLKKDTEI